MTGRKRKKWTKDSAFLKYGTEEFLDEDFIDNIDDGIDGDEKNGKKPEKDDEENDADGEDRRHFYKDDVYEKRDLYKDDMDQYSIDAMDVLMDTARKTERRKVIDVHTQDPHLRKLVLKEKQIG